MAVAVAVAVVLAGCSNDAGGGGKDDATPTTMERAPTTIAPAPISVGCRASIAAVRGRLGARPEVLDVGIASDCSTLVVATSLATDARAEARVICDEAAEVAYGGESAKLLVIGASVGGDVSPSLATGVRGQQCESPADTVGG
jgi:hypothetical protein